MAGLLAWAADVVGGHGGGQTNEADAIPITFTEEQQNYVRELDRKATSLSRTIQDLRLRLPPPDISQRLPHLHAHSLASNAALALQLNAHSATKEHAQLREVTLLEENVAYEKAISNCENKIQEKIQEADLLRRKLQEMDENEKNLRQELENAETALNTSQSGRPGESVVYETEVETEPDTLATNSTLLEKLENKKKELSSMEEIVQDLEKKWAQVQDSALKQPMPAQREKILDKQLHSLIEQLAAKQAQAEGLVSEIHLKEMELERLNGLWRQLESSNAEANTARNRFGRSNSGRGFASSDYISDKLPYSTGGQTEQQQRLMLMRSAFVLYILMLHILVFIKISF
ncbi:hypothetical protein P3X46_029573 [Hevea brasiliensis]|uniref:Uncharacterized protein n=2 Tax=Hevea brasiliensis TaxID=3981 RepID=A0ABQ9KVR6_HEVBR|nr:uncharacterized protein LOC110671562 [Hevea brasiliensis]KAF2313742.1 hypothetical protein GH714_013089 [Hevea brasiliensis]KAJ9147408.1 hypothetical protein P3X46_029573 [Hevea brasiliensis]